MGRYAAPLLEAVGLLKTAGGKTVVAHPWSRGSDKVLTGDAFEALAEAGLDGIEVDHNDLDLVITGSSPSAPRADSRR
ncbi:hypothetical protein [Aeromicrobium chenweiae]|uniref:Uncharacterized protein n=1 Tax=Aeromicrobium chenweiae TaxID=2079793 RepID=A0A2S0WPC6_9ACTN|nr:hypothetical protein [Aeromicrobium chenweiae]AWB93161.1 hypothetical protein C3E78_13650 [Aeromicrobium chenweiae]TGN34151.1 hypothetical protein E4L97_03685 [Aeromicrobium chenweiae]